MNKQTFTIPEGCTEISVEQDGDKLIATFGKSSKFEPKEGDVCAMSYGWKNPMIFFYTHKRGDNTAIGINTDGEYINGMALYNDEDMLNIRLATPEESRKLFDALGKEGLQWDAENKKLVKMRWKPENGKPYWFFNDEFQTACKNWEGHTMDLLRRSAGNCFETVGITCAAIELIEQTLITFHNEN